MCKQHIYKACGSLPSADSGTKDTLTIITASVDLSRCIINSTNLSVPSVTVYEDESNITVTKKYS